MDCRREGLGHVFWLGGSACAGKTHIAKRLARQRDLAVYHCDDHFADHRARADPRQHPGFHRLMERSGEALFAPPPAQQVDELRAFYEDELGMVRQDLTGFDTDDDTALGLLPVLVEGAGLLPAKIARWIPSPNQALWLVSTADFRRRHRPQSGPQVAELLSDCRDPQAAYRRWMARDELYAEWLSGEVRRIGGRVLRVDGSSSLEETIDRIASGLGLGQSRPQGPAT
ncbi:MAG: hypothetical protein AAF657_03755 [Acidobacteriota bacterium]